FSNIDVILSINDLVIFYGCNDEEFHVKFQKMMRSLRKFKGGKMSKKYIDFGMNYLKRYFPTKHRFYELTDNNKIKSIINKKKIPEMEDSNGLSINYEYINSLEQKGMNQINKKLLREKKEKGEKKTIDLELKSIDYKKVKKRNVEFNSKKKQGEFPLKLEKK
ncbi:MAG: hypothetical protein ACTSRG_21920, partial [Candidatus Helarchaeota archaeon]